MSLKDDLIKAREFDYSKQWWMQFKDSSQEDVQNGAQQQHAKDQKLFELLCDVAAAGEVKMIELQGYAPHHAILDPKLRTIIKTLDALKAHIAKEQA